MIKIEQNTRLLSNWKNWLFYNYTKSRTGYSLIELIVTVSIMAILAAVVVPTYIESQGEAKGKISQANMINIKQAFINNFYNSVIDRHRGEFPPEPTDYKMTYQWADNTILYNGKSVSELFSEGHITYNPYNHPYLYQLLDPGGIPLPPGSDPDEAAGFMIKEPDIGYVMKFIP